MQTEEYLHSWLDTFVRPFKAPNTAACYARAIAALPRSVCECELAALDGMQLQAALNAQARRYPRAAQLTYTTLHAAFAQAVRLGYLARSPLDACIKPQHSPARAAVLDGRQLAAYLSAARAEPAFALLLLMAMCGIRRGEALGLMWQDIEISGSVGILHVRRQRMRVGGRYMAMPLKSLSSARDLPLAPPIIHELSTLRFTLPIRSYAGWLCDISPEALARAHYRAIEAAQLPHVTLHGLRHSMATAAVASGCSIKVLQGILGHSTYHLTADLYADHLTAAQYAPDMSRLAASIMG